MVYAMGPDLSIFELLDQTIRTNLVPDYDLNRRFPQPTNEAEPTVLGLRTREDPTGSSLKVIGAAAYRMALAMKMEQTMRNVIESLPDNISFNDLLTPIRSQNEAAHNFMPYDMNQHVNFLTDDWTMLAVHISAKYPAIADYKSPGSAQGQGTSTASSDSLVGVLAEMIVRSRRQKGMKIKTGSLSLNGPDVLPVPPNGREFQETWDKALSRLEEYLQQNKKEG